MTHGSSRPTFATMRTLPSADGHFAPEPGPQPMTRPASLGGWSSAFHYAAWPSFELWAIMTRGGYREDLYAPIASASADALNVWHRGEPLGRNNLPPRFVGTAGSKSLPPYALSDAETTTVKRATTTVE